MELVGLGFAVPTSLQIHLDVVFQGFVRTFVFQCHQRGFRPGQQSGSDSSADESAEPLEDPSPDEPSELPSVSSADVSKELSSDSLSAMSRVRY